MMKRMRKKIHKQKKRKSTKFRVSIFSGKLLWNVCSHVLRLLGAKSTFITSPPTYVFFSFLLSDIWFEGGDIRSFELIRLTRYFLCSCVYLRWSTRDKKTVFLQMKTCWVKEQKRYWSRLIYKYINTQKSLQLTDHKTLLGHIWRIPDCNLSICDW